MREERDNNSQIVRLSSLKPHFLFNVLNSLKCEVIIDAPDKVELLDDFAVYLRFILRYSENNNMIHAKEIFTFLTSYARLEEARYDQLEIIFEIETLHFQLEALTIFELIYNAIHHGLGGNAPGGKVWIRTRKKQKGVSIEIQDNGKGFCDNDYEAALAKHKNLFHIYESMKRKGAEFEVQSCQETGTVVRMELKDTEMK